MPADRSQTGMGPRRQHGPGTNGDADDRNRSLERTIDRDAAGDLTEDNRSHVAGAFGREGSFEREPDESAEEGVEGNIEGTTERNVGRRTER